MKENLCSICKFSKEIKHPRNGDNYWKCTNKEKNIKYPALPVVECGYYFLKP